jgi:hypothetical protein
VQDARELSSQLLDAMRLEGEVTEPGPGVAECEGMSPERYFVVRHPWSVYGVPVPDMEAAMERLRDDLPGRGWEVTKYGPDKSPSRSLEIFADHKHGDKQFSVNIRLFDERGKNADHVSMINVTLVSACFRTPEGEEPDFH